jgi:ABC-type Mn2+/Zn2+ transport system permease subunit
MFIPLVLVKRESQFTQAQADAVFGALVLGNKVKWALFGVLLGISLICACLTIMYIRKRKATRKLQERQTESLSLLVTDQ